MSILNHLGEAAAILLLIELLVVVLIFAGVAGGLAFGLRWVHGKTGWASSKAETGLALGTRYVRMGLDYAGKPFIMAAGFTTAAQGTLQALRREVRRVHESTAPTSVAPAAVPVPPPALSTAETLQVPAPGQETEQIPIPVNNAP